MPIILPPEIRRVTKDEFSQIAYDTMQVIFSVHNRLGRFFREEIYQQAILEQLPTARTEVPVKVVFATFSHDYSLDLLVDGATLFELKAVSSLADRHRAQLLNYLMLTGLPHGKLVNLRPDLVVHEFVNCAASLADRTSFRTEASRWDGTLGGACDIYPWIIAALRDWGTGLDLSLYEAACTHFLGGEMRVMGTVEIVLENRVLGTQPVLLAAPDVAFKITAISPRAWPAFEDHLGRFVASSSLSAIQWINITRDVVCFTTIRGNQ